MSATIPHTFEQLDQGIGVCLNCNQSSTSAPPICTGRQIPIAMATDYATLWREADRLARQMEGFAKRMYAFRDALKQSTAG